MVDWWDPATYRGLESLITSKGVTPLNLAISGSGATNTVHALSDVDIFGTLRENAPTLNLTEAEIVAALDLTGNPSIWCKVRGNEESALKFATTNLSQYPYSWRIWEIERTLLYPKIYEHPTLTGLWRTVPNQLAQDLVATWYLNASYERVSLWDDNSEEAASLERVQQGIRLALSGAYLLETQALLVDAKALFEWAEVSFDWSFYWLHALEDVAVKDYAALYAARKRLQTDLEA
jgi:hypothetical protein